MFGFAGGGEGSDDLVRWRLLSPGFFAALGLFFSLFEDWDALTYRGSRRLKLEFCL